MKRFLPIFLAVAVVSSGWAAEKTAFSTHALPVGNHGTLTVTIPGDWHFHRGVSAPGKPQTARMHPEKGGGTMIQVTVFWDGFGTKVEKPTEEDMVRIIRKVVEAQYVAVSVEKQVVLEKFKGPKVTGTFARFTDARWVEKAPPKGEYRNVASGMFRSGNLWGDFTVLTPDKDGPAFKQAMAILESLAKS